MAKSYRTVRQLRFAVIFLAFLLTASHSFAAEPETQTDLLAQKAIELEARFESWKTPEYYRLKSLTTGYWGELNADPSRELVGIDENGTPIILYTDNANAALTTRAADLHPGGSSGYNRSGALSFGLAVWDNGVANPNNPEFAGHVSIGDGSESYEAHANHTCGTVAAAGINASAKGMSFGAQLNSFDWSMDRIEMAQYASWLKISSHSYHYGGAGYGGYESSTADLDEIQYLAPYYNIVIAATNDGPGYGTIYASSCGKNAITVGAVHDVDQYNGPGSVSIANFSSRGPTQDGRLKPDIVANGVNLYSTLSVGYTYMSGTSMSTPNAAGSLFLLVEHYEQTHMSQIPRAATIKAIATGTADEAGIDGPDYTYGWGLLNVRAAADLVSADADQQDIIQELELIENEPYEYTFTASGDQPLKVTVAWTEPPATPGANPSLINDLDLQVVRVDNGTVYEPWVLNPNVPSQAASTGDNDRDNVEQVFVADPEAVEYRVIVDHEGPLQDNSQFFSLVIDGMSELAPVRLIVTPSTNIIGPGGGVLNYDVSLVNDTPDTYPGQRFWTMVILPNGNEFGPLYQSPWFTLQSGASMSRQLSQPVPAGAPLGIYTFTAYVGSYPDIMLTDSFEFEKVLSTGIGDGGGIVDGWEGGGSWDQDPNEAAGTSLTIPKRFTLAQPWPNPFNSETRIQVDLPQPSNLQVVVHDVTGRTVETLADGDFEAGQHVFTFNAEGLASGTYIVSAQQINLDVQQKKMVYLK